MLLRYGGDAAFVTVGGVRQAERRWTIAYPWCHQFVAISRTAASRQPVRIGRYRGAAGDQGEVGWRIGAAAFEVHLQRVDEVSGERFRVVVVIVAVHGHQVPLLVVRVSIHRRAQVDTEDDREDDHEKGDPHVDAYHEIAQRARDRQADRGEQAEQHDQYHDADLKRSEKQIHKISIVQQS